MSITLMSQVWKMALGTTDKMVLLALADWSNDDGACWPSMRQLAEKTSLTDRAIRASVARLCEAGHLTRKDVLGRGVNYTVHPGTSCPPERLSPRNHVPKTPEPRSTNTSVTTNTSSEANASSEGRAPVKRETATRLPEGWRPLPAEWTMGVTALGPERAAAELEKFTDYWRAVPGAKGRKLDWPATFRNWIRRASESRSNVRPANDHRAAKADHLGSVARAMAAACGGSEPEHRGDRPRPGDAGGSPAMLPAA